MKLEIILVTLFCFTSLKALQKNGDSIKFEVGGSSKKVMDDIRKSISGIKDDTVGGEGSGDDDEDVKEGSGPGFGVKDTGSGTLTNDAGSGAISTTTKTIVDGQNTTPEVLDITVVTTVKSNPTKSNDINDEVTVGRPAKNDVIPKSKAAATAKKQEKTGVNFTVGIIVGVVVGAILAILVIVFLVYRLRKKDEGSYSLDEQSSAAFIRDEKSPQGKEYYA